MCRGLRFATCLAFLSIISGAQATPTALQNPALTKLSALCEIAGQTYGAGAKTLSLIGEDGKILRSTPTAISNVAGLSPYRKGAAIIGDAGSSTIFTLDLRTGATKRLFRLVDVDASGSIAAPALKSGKLSSLACDGRYVYVAVSAGYSSSIFRIDPDARRVIAHTWAPGDRPSAMAWQNGRLFVLDSKNAWIRCCDAAMKMSRSAVDIPVSDGRGLVVKGDEVRVLSPSTSSIVRLPGQVQRLSKDPPQADISPVRSIPRPLIVKAVAHRTYALLICGDTAESGFDEFWNDTASLYKTLLNLGYESEDIFVLYGDGRDYASANPRYRYPGKITDYPATIPWVNRVLDGLRNGDTELGIPRVTGDDTLFVWTSGRGGWGNTASLGLRDANMTDTAFAARLNAVSCRSRAIFMQQSHGGGFIDNLQSKRTFISTACAESEIAERADTESEIWNGKAYHHGEYTFHLVSALSGKTPDDTPANADREGDAMVSARDAHEWILSRKTTPETPQMSNPGSAGDTLVLKYQ